MKWALRLIVITACTIFLSACKVVIEVPKGGHVTTESGAITCGTLKTCEIDIVDVFFDETFVAVPNKGMYFNGWKKRERGFAGGSYDPVQLQTHFFAGYEVLMDLLASDEIFYLTPTFSDQCTANCDVATLKLLMSDALSFFPQAPKELSWPYSSNATIVAQVSGIPQPTTYAISTFSLQASGSDFTITNLDAHESTYALTPFFKGISNRMVIRDGETLEFKLVSPLTGGRTVQLVYGFSILETGQSFKSYVTFRSN